MKTLYRHPFPGVWCGLTFHNGFCTFSFQLIKLERLLNRSASRSVYKARKKENVCVPLFGIQNTELGISGVLKKKNEAIGPLFTQVCWHLIITIWNMYWFQVIIDLHSIKKKKLVLTMGHHGVCSYFVEILMCKTPSQGWRIRQQAISTHFSPPPGLRMYLVTMLYWEEDTTEGIHLWIYKTQNCNKIFRKFLFFAWGLVLALAISPATRVCQVANDIASYLLAKTPLYCNAHHCRT